MNTIWILNHYAVDMFFDKGGRHLEFAKRLKKRNYDVKIFCANQCHKENAFVHIPHGKHIEKLLYNIPFIFIKTISSNNNGIRRLMNMYLFYRNLKKVVKKQLKEKKPDIILASSVHPLTLVAGINIGKKYSIPVICEVRDLWPESIVAYSSLKKTNPLIRIMYCGERWIYRRANKLIFTWEGGRKYIKDKGWENAVDLRKVHHINNGVNMDCFRKQANKNSLKDLDLLNPNVFKIVYTGSIRKVNNLVFIVNICRQLKKRGFSNIKFIIYGDGNEREVLERTASKEKLTNIVFKGPVSKNQIPYILSRADINLLHNASSMLDVYGQSQNKLFEYLAAGKPILQTYSTKYSIIEKYDAGIMSKKQDVDTVCQDILSLIKNERLRKRFGSNAIIAAKDYDYERLTDKLINIIENVRS